MFMWTRATAGFPGFLDQWLSKLIHGALDLHLANATDLEVRLPESIGLAPGTSGLGSVLFILGVVTLYALAFAFSRPARRAWLVTAATAFAMFVLLAALHA